MSTPDTAPLRILVVEDSAFVREQLQSLFQNVAGVEIIAFVEDGDAALEVIPTSGADVVLLDVHIPGRSGVEVLRAVRRTFPGTIIMLTNFADPLTRRRCIETGADHFFDKSTEYRDMLRVVRELRDRRTTQTSGPDLS